MPAVAPLSSQRVLVCIPSFGTEQMPLTIRQVQALDACGMRGDLVIHGTHPVPVSGRNLRVTNIVVPVELGERIPWLHRRYMAERRHQYDLFLYTEDDIYIEAHHLQTLLDLNTILPPDRLPGLLRYERAQGDPRRYLTDAHGDFPVFDWAEIHAGEVFFAIQNKFSASYLLTRVQLGQALRSGAFLREPAFSWPYGVIESASADIYVHCGFRKVLSLPRLESLLVHHMSDKYANETEGLWARKPHTVESLVALVKEHLPR